MRREWLLKRFGGRPSAAAARCSAAWSCSRLTMRPEAQRKSGRRPSEPSWKRSGAWRRRSSRASTGQTSASAL
eukprot:1628253-Pyramimonas_sp.AAC.1